MNSILARNLSAVSLRDPSLSALLESFVAERHARLLRDLNECTVVIIAVE